MNQFFGFFRTRLLALLSATVWLFFAPATIRGTLAPAHKIDLLIKREGGSEFRGDDIRNLTGNGQMVRLNLRRKGKLFIRVQNEGEVPDTFKMRGSTVNRNFRLKYFHAGMNVTGAVRRGDLITPEVPTADVLTPDFVVKILVKKKARGTGKTRSIQMMGESTGAPVGDGTDVVKAKLRAR